MSPEGTAAAARATVGLEPREEPSVLSGLCSFPVGSFGFATGKATVGLGLRDEPSVLSGVLSGLLGSFGFATGKATVGLGLRLGPSVLSEVLSGLLGSFGFAEVLGVGASCCRVLWSSSIGRSPCPDAGGICCAPDRKG